MQNSETIKDTRHVKLYPDIPFKHLINLVQESEPFIRRLEEKDTGRDIFASDTVDSVSFIASLNCLVGTMPTNTV